MRLKALQAGVRRERPGQPTLWLLGLAEAEVSYLDARSHDRRRPKVCPGCCAALIRTGRAVAGRPCEACYYEDPKRWGRKVVSAVVLLLALFGGAGRAAEEDRTFHPVDLSAYSKMAPGSGSIPTHIQVTGWVTYKKAEKDGDVHLRLCDGEDCIVAEAIPELPEIAAQARALRVPVKVTVRGISRYDGAPGHHWNEVHPVLGLEVAP